MSSIHPQLAGPACRWGVVNPPPACRRGVINPPPGLPVGCYQSTSNLQVGCNGSRKGNASHFPQNSRRFGSSQCLNDHFFVHIRRSNRRGVTNSEDSYGMYTAWSQMHMSIQSTGSFPLRLTRCKQSTSNFKVQLAGGVQSIHLQLAGPTCRWGAINPPPTCRSSLPVGCN